jgi:hypothetical protein
VIVKLLVQLGQGRTTSLSLLIDNKLPRAYPGGTGGVKNISNYSPVSYLF